MYYVYTFNYVSCQDKIQFSTSFMYRYFKLYKHRLFKILNLNNICVTIKYVL